MSITAGKYLAKAHESTGIFNSKEKGTPGIEIMFKTESGDMIRWTGWLTEKAKDRTLEALALCGLQEVSKLTRLMPETTTAMLPATVELVVEMEIYDGPNPEYQGKSFPRVRWVNKVGGSGHVSVDGRMDTADQVKFIEQLKSSFEAAKKKAGAPAIQPVAVPAPTPLQGKISF